MSFSKLWLQRLKPFLLFQICEKVIHAFISSRLLYSNSLCAGVSQSSLSGLQYVQNTAAQFLTQKHFSHIRPHHQLPVLFRIHFKILPNVYKALQFGSLLPSRLSCHAAHICLILSPVFCISSFLTPHRRLSHLLTSHSSLWNKLSHHIRSTPLY